MSRQIAVPWLRNAFFAEIQPHPLPHVSVDLHQGAHGSITDLKEQTNLDFGFVPLLNPACASSHFQKMHQKKWQILVYEQAA